MCRVQGGTPVSARKYNSEVLAVTRLLGAMLMLSLAGAVATAQPPPSGTWREAREYLPLFAPPGARASAYRIFVTSVALEALLPRLIGEPSLLRPPGAWLATPTLAGDAFGLTGRYDRSRLARVYGARRPLVARGPRGAAGRPTEAWTMISPYPSRDLTRLEPGTLLDPKRTVYGATSPLAQPLPD